MDISRDMISQLADNALYRLMGITVVEAAAGKAHLELHPDPKVQWPTPGQPHGGVLFTLMDTAMAWAVITILSPGQSCVTIDLHIQYPKPARGGHFSCTAETTYQTRALSFARAEIHDPEGGLVGLGQGTFRIIEGDFIP